MGAPEPDGSTGRLAGGGKDNAVMAQSQLPPGTCMAGAVRAARSLWLWCGLLLLLAVTAGAFAQGGQLGFDRNDYPGQAALPELRRHFAFAGYWLNAPPGERASSWLGHREALIRAGFGFLLLWNGKLDAEIVQAGKAGTHAEALGRVEAEAAIRAARAEGFPMGAVLFLDQEEGGRLLPEQAAFLLAWTEAVSQTGYRPGVYASGQPVDEGPAPGGRGRVTITTAEDIGARVRAGGLHEVALWVAQDACPPAPGCVLVAPALAKSGTPRAAVWQFAQSPRRPAITAACARTYGADGNCGLEQLPGMPLDFDVAETSDPSHGR